MLPFHSLPIARRHFVQGLAVGGAVAGFTPALLARSTAASAAELRGTEFDLEIAELPVNFTGKRRVATAVNGAVPAPVLRLLEGDTVTLRVRNSLKEMSSIHWHGIILPAEMDGVPGISFAGIAPGETFTYRFELRQSGTYWYHAHTLAEQTGFYGAIVVEPRGPVAAPDRDYTVILSDWSDEPPLQIFTNLKKLSSYYNFAQPTAGDFLKDVRQLGLGKALDRRAMWNGARMSPTDYSDVSAATYTYLMNGTPPAGNWTGIAAPGERVRLRFICAGTATFFDVRIPGVALTIVATDGQPVEPVTVDEFRIGPGETYDAEFTMPDAEAHTIFAQSIDRTGYARGTIAPAPGMTAAVPPLDERPWLEPIDMMGAMAAMDGGEHAGHGMAEMPPKARHARTEYGANTDMRVDYPRRNLDDPGAGLRDRPWRVLTLADLRTPNGDPDPREPEREIELHLNGNMERFIWALDGIKLNDSRPLHFRPNERLRVTLVNDTMMSHPMHLHGMWSDVEGPDGKFRVRKHTVVVQPAQRVSFRVTADAMGRWAFHCHLLYHMAAGMFREVVVA